MADNIDDNDLIQRMNNANDTGLTEEGAKVAELLDTIEKNPEILEQHPELKEFYDVALKMKSGNAKVDNDRIIIEDNIDKINKRVQEEFGYDTVEDLIEASKTWKKGSETYDQWNTLIQTAPTSLSTAISLYLQGNEDWNKAIALDSKIDFSKPVANQSRKELVRFYFPNQFTDEELNTVGSPDAEESVKRALKMSEGFFDAEHRKYNSVITENNDRNKKIIDSQRKALDKNREALKKKYPSMTESQVSKLINTLTNGSYARHFLNPEGIFNEKAAENLIALEMPDFYIKNVMGKKAEDVNKQKMELLSRNSDFPALKGKLTKTDKPDPLNEAKKALLTKRHTYTATPYKQ